jgi:predicted ABC-type ATPase
MLKMPKPNQKALQSIVRTRSSATTENTNRTRKGAVFLLYSKCDTTTDSRNSFKVRYLCFFMKQLYIIAGPNGAGKTTASYTILPEIFDCYEFVNADEIAKGLSPFNPESVGLQAGRLMLNRIDELIKKEKTFAFETTLSTKSYHSLILRVKELGYEVILLFLCLNSKELAIRRVKTRVTEGGHNIPTDVIERRFENGLQNLFNRYVPIVDSWMLIDNSNEHFDFIAKGSKDEISIINSEKWIELKQKYYGE